MSVFTTESASREFARRTALGRTVLALTPRRHHSRALWGVYRVVSGWHTVCFAVLHRDLTCYVLRSQRGRPARADVAPRRVRYWIFRMMGSYRYLVTHTRPGEVVIVDEGFVHRVVQLHTSAVESPRGSAVATYVSLLPRPDLVVHVDASVSTCQERVVTRGIWKRLAHRGPDEINQFVRNAHHAVTLARREIGRQGWTVIDVDNDTDDLAATTATLRKRLFETALVDSRPVEVG